MFHALSGQLVQGVPLNTIVAKIRAGKAAGSNGPSRWQLVTTKDLHNIRDKYKIGKKEQRDASDFRSVELWVEEMEAAGDNSPLLYFKKHGQLSSYEQDFELALMTLPQRKLLQKLGSAKLCIDSTHGTNMYKFFLTTLLTVTEDGAGMPCAYLISKRVDTETMVQFFEAIKKKANVIHCKAFMSDDAPAFGNAWEQVMGPVQHRLLCSWHVMRNWNKHLAMVTNQKVQDSVREILITLMKCTATDNFEELLQGFRPTLSKRHDIENLPSKEKQELETIIKYFENTYAKRAHQWALCYRKCVGLTTNNYVEAMHRTLKHSYMKSKDNRRLDKLVWVLFTMTADKIYNRGIALVKGTPDRRKTELFQKHKASMELPQSDIKAAGEGEWQVKSQSLQKFWHTVQRTSKACSGCELHCEYCQACHSMYTCSCLDHVTYAHMCKHIHAVASQQLVNPSDQAGSSADMGSECFLAIDDPRSLMVSAHEIVLSAAKGMAEKTQGALQTSMEAAFQKAMKVFSEMPLEKCKAIHDDLMKFIAKHQLHGPEESASKKSAVMPPNKNVEKQPRYGVPKEKRAGAAFRHVPTLLQQEAIKQQLISGEEEALFIHSGNDHDYCRSSSRRK